MDDNHYRVRDSSSDQGRIFIQDAKVTHRGFPGTILKLTDSTQRNCHQIQTDKL